MSRHVILAVDPGVKGGWALYSTQGGPAQVYDLPTIKAARGKSALDVDAGVFITRLNVAIDVTLVHAYVELVQSRPRQGSQFSFGKNYGKVLGALEAAGIPITHVSASKWKPAMGLRGEDKIMSVKLAEQLFPALKSRLYGPKGGPLDGRAEALLLCYYGAHHAN